MARWEYRKIHLSELPRQGDDIDLLNAAGNDGWELVSITNSNIAYLKRPITEANPEVAAKPARRKRVPSSTTDTD